MKESESKQECCNLDMPNGLHEDKLYLKYPQQFVRAPLSQHPSKSPENGKHCDPSKVMGYIGM
jgi:hypothetical protein